MKVGVIADDLTGANATGVKLVKQGFEAATMVYYDQPLGSGSYNAVCIDTDSRYARKDVAEMRIKKSIENLKIWGADVICKRIDSTVRGNIGIEVDKVLNELGEKSIAIVVASFPDSSRITSGGYLLVNGVPVQATDVANDPVTPLTESYVPSIIKKQSEHPVAHLGLETVLQGKDVILQDLKKQIQEGNRIIVMDAVTDEEIEDIAHAMALIEDYQLVPVDPGPLTAYYSNAFTSQHTQSKKVIVTVGSVTSLSAEQLDYLINKTDAIPIYVDAHKLASLSESWETEVDRVVQEALAQIQLQDILVITTNSPAAERLDLKRLSAEQGVSQDQLAKRIADGLGKVTRVVIQSTSYEIGGCFSSGGDVTASLCSVGRAEGIKLKDEILPLVAYGEFMGGYFDGLPIATKGGMVGDKKAIHTIIKHLLTNQKSTKQVF
ncbi:four-carbon acid sugar kinase family protein [Fictibacillus phosphorivorans]|uniref:four-carbon acid sugar kinase family protein n=1 Tax=Fictibacillus phosphorivorans TaxID=1221500 RepID=UPI0020407AB5|nr:four-carbon acid sugar kinase family protein [Fictibacillus phosphorivorans]MCM3717819.1 four-carbon acid sugar kinase family protein [Fictibacillus phosphorivorans]MCM3777047.1 four-carbon acid sugar kinase family protein [Fictibacillus phosphorivorans]